jgi:hypothetical protein
VQVAGFPASTSSSLQKLPPVRHLECVIMLNGDPECPTRRTTAFAVQSVGKRRDDPPSGCRTVVGNRSGPISLRLESGVRHALVVLVGLSCAVATARATAPDVIYVGNVVTMESASPRAEAVAVAGERVVAVGKRAEVLAMRGPRTRVVELGDGALLPGFIDSHGHVTASAAQARLANLQPPPAGPIRSISELQQALRQHIRERAIPPGQWVIGFGYDDGQLAERRHPSRDDLDAVSREHPILLTHVSGHLGSTNSRALADSGIDAASADPDGGAIRRRPGTREPDGVLEETAAFAIQTKIPASSLDQALEALARALDDYASRGITTIQDGGVQPDNLALLRAAAQRGVLDLDVIAYRYWIPAVSTALPADFSVGPYRGRLRIGGIKIGLDGSPQGKTAFLTEPYVKPPAGQGPDYRGYPAMPAAAVIRGVRETLVRGVPLLAHANGDAAAQVLVDAVEAARRETGRSDPLVVMIHAQTVRDDQLDRMLALNIMPSFFVGHTFYWGDWHRDETLGPRRAERISPTRSAIDRKVPFTIHNDAPIVPPDMIRTLWSATTRRTRSNDILGAAQRLTIAEALAALTIDGARQYGEQADKGSIAKGKLADLVILDRDPLALDPERLQDVVVVETISRGRTVYRRQ